MRIYEIDPGEKDDVTHIRPDPDMDKKLAIANPNLRFANLIEYKCSDALKAMRQAKQVLYRGIQNPPSAAFHGRSRNRRDPMMANTEFVHQFNVELSKMGIAANRVNSISTTIDSGVAHDFGDAVFYIFPINGFQFMWSSQVGDFGLFFSKYNVKPTKEMLQALAFSGDNFVAALKSGNEISIHGEYYAVEVEPPESGTTLAQYLKIV